MSVDIGESLMQSWLRHIKNCDLVQTNWKAAMHIVFNKSKAEDLLAKILAEPAFHFFPRNQRVEQLIRQTEIDVLGCVVAKKKYFAGDIAFHESGLHYSKGQDTVPSKMLRTLLCLYGFLDATEATIIFATPSTQSPAERVYLENFVDTLNGFLKNTCGLPKYQAKLYADYQFETGILNPVLYHVDKIKDTSEVFVRACQLIRCTRAAGKQNALISASGAAEYISTASGTIDVSELSTQELIEKYILPTLSSESKRGLKPYFDKADSRKMFKASYPFLSSTPIYSSGSRSYAEAYYLEKTKQTVYITSQFSKAAQIEWINAHN